MRRVLLVVALLVAVAAGVIALEGEPKSEHFVLFAPHGRSIHGSAQQAPARIGPALLRISKMPPLQQQRALKGLEERFHVHGDRRSEGTGLVRIH